MLHLRYPSINGQDMKSVSGYIGTEVGEGAVRVGAGGALTNRTDYDGDMGNFIPILPTGADAEDAMKGTLALQAQQDKIAAAMLASAGFDKESENLVEVDESMQGQTITNVGGVVGKINRPKIGILSNAATKVRNALTTRSADEMTENPQMAAAGIITRALFESLEQDAISSKKVEKRILDMHKAADVSEEEKEQILNQTYSDLEVLIDKMMNPKSDYSLDEFIGDLQNIGILGNDQELLKGKSA
jgi:hypothetical protein